MAGTRSAKRAADAAPANDSSVDPPAPKRARRAAAAKANASDDDDARATKSTAKSKAKKTKATEDDAADFTAPTAGKAKSKATADAPTDPAKPKAKPRGKGKAKLETDDRDEDEVKVEDEQVAAGATDLATIDDAVPEVANAQFAKSKNLQVQLDEECQMPGYKVYIDSDNGIIYDAALNQTNAGNNNNKFYKIQLLTNGHDFRTFTRWGRVGERGQSALLGSGGLQDAQTQFDKKFKDKSGLKWVDRGSDPKSGKYVFIEKSYEADLSEDEAPAKSTKTAAKAASRSGSPPKCTLQPQVKSLMELIFNQEYIEQVMQDLNYDPEKLPLGKLSKATITRGYQTLKDLAALMSDPSLAQSKHDTDYNAAVQDLSNRYYSYIPHAFGRNRPPVIQSHDMLKREVDLMDSLTDLKDGDQIIKAEIDDIEPVHPLDSRFKGLGLQEMTPVAPSTAEFDEISKYLVKTCGETHAIQYEVRDVFRIERQGEFDRFEKSKFAKIASDRRLLWHGSRATNFGGILSQGLRIAPPEAPVSGYMFGKGIYLADMSSKSANYCCSYNSGGEALLLLCEAELGNPIQALADASYTAGEDAVAKGMWSTWGQGRIAPKGWKDAGCVHPSLAGVSMPDTTQAPGKTNLKTQGLYGGLYYNEYICYDVAQVRLRYLLRVKT